MVLDQGKQRHRIGAGEKSPGIDTQLFPLRNGTVVLKQMVQALEIIHLKKHRPGNVETKALFIPPDPLSAPGTAVIPKIHTEFHQVLCFDVAGGMLHQRIVRTVLMLQHRAGRLEKVALKTAFGKMQRHVHQIPDTPLGVFFQPLQSLPDSGLY